MGADSVEKMVADAVNAMGAMAEMVWVFYTQLVERGFEKKDALELCKAYVGSLMK